MTQTYSCDFCDAVFKEPCHMHEATCDCNPANKTCSTCKLWDYQDCDKSRQHWKPQGGPWESEDDMPCPMGCHHFNDQTFRKYCVMWQPRTKRQ